ncbi:MAG TPA: hypothetical protein VF599_01790 [Pyrinomonadaceae bacterium]|jgi:hypothetical protein
MKKIPVLIFSVIALFSLAAQVSAQSKKSPPPRVRAAPLDASRNNSQTNFLGEFDAGTYKNKFFGVKITVPEKWVIQESEFNQAIKQVGSEIVQGKNAQSEKALDAAMQRLTVLFSVSKDIIGMGNNAIMILSAEKASALVPYRNGEDYLRLNVESFKKLQLPPDFKYSETINSEKFGNETFYSLDIQRTGYKQKFYATARRGYALFFTLTYITEKDLETMKTVIRNSDFSWKE